MILLSLNGGGAKGYITTCLLEKIHAEFPDRKLYELFDYISGVSTGSIICGLIAKGDSGKTIREKYEIFLPLIFKKPRNIFFNIFKSKYDREEFQNIARLHLDFPIKESKTKFMLSSLRMTGDEVRPKFWKSWKDDIKVYDAVLASCAAPTYFDPYKINDDVYIDGGFSSNNPSVSLICEVLKNCGPTDNLDIVNINITCDYVKGYKNAKKMRGIKDWILDIPQIILHGGSASDKYQADVLLGDNNIFVQPRFFGPLDTDDLKGMRKEADRLWEIHGYNIIEKIKKNINNNNGDT
jgi:patatin-like phospholipase/acyl hydrolase